MHLVFCGAGLLSGMLEAWEQRGTKASARDGVTSQTAMRQAYHKVCVTRYINVCQSNSKH